MHPKWRCLRQLRCQLVRGVATDTAAENPCNGCVTVSAVSSLSAAGCGKACTSKVTVLASRLIPGAYAFRFSGIDSSNNPVAVAGTITVVSNSSMSGLESELTSAGHAQNSITGGSFTPSTLGDKNTNNAGTLKLTTGTFPNQYQVVIDASGNFQLIESDGHGTGSGVMQKTSIGQFNNAAQTFAFGLSGADSIGKRVGYVGVLPLNGSGLLKTGGQLDTNDNGATNSLGCGQPCSVGGSYQYNATTGLGQLTLTTSVTQHFDFFVAAGNFWRRKSLDAFCDFQRPDGCDSSRHFRFDGLSISRYNLRQDSA